MCPVIHSYPQAGAQGCGLAALRDEPYTGQSGLYTGDWGRSSPVLGTATKRWWTYPQALWTTLGTAFPCPQLVHKPSLPLCVRRGCGRSGARAEVSLCTRSAVRIAPSVEKPYKPHNACQARSTEALRGLPVVAVVGREHDDGVLVVVLGLRRGVARRGDLRCGAGNPSSSSPGGAGTDDPGRPAGTVEQRVQTGSARHVRLARVRTLPRCAVRPAGQRSRWLPGSATGLAPHGRRPDLRGRRWGLQPGAQGAFRGRGLGGAA